MSGIGRRFVIVVEHFGIIAVTLLKIIDVWQTDAIF